MHKVKQIILMVIAFVYYSSVMAQDVATDTKTGEGFMRTEGKVYVVAAVVITILIGLLIYVARIDRKLTKMEKGKV
jgi:uncharacterized membrane protein